MESGRGFLATDSGEACMAMIVRPFCAAQTATNVLSNGADSGLVGFNRR